MMRFRLLGPVEVRAGEDWLGIGAPKWRAVLAALLIHPGQIVSADTLISELWRDDPPARAANLVSIYVLRLRRLMDDPDGHLLVTRAPGYQLQVSGDDTDALLFEAMVRDGRRAFAAGDPEGAASRLTEALALWYGRPLADVPPTPLVEAEAERLTELRLGAVELRITAELTLGAHDQAVAELRAKAIPKTSPRTIRTPMTRTKPRRAPRLGECRTPSSPRECRIPDGPWPGASCM